MIKWFFIICFAVITYFIFTYFILIYVFCIIYCKIFMLLNVNITLIMSWFYFLFYRA